ncbi:hypothetical protein AGRA3207_003608 [Actinomadura graeca]|uniref:Extracellular repeat, HAF family n=1 Tax=Actinomadura graeca TaxID=2750812 RepID=A0ABX8QX73_9ACTN|nr:hypothetical protein [Actinomadura graeca]QXJ22584.1 hypothetical protein AGRA3207_003608 [Actinomadura graeca]
MGRTASRMAAVAGTAALAVAGAGAATAVHAAAHAAAPHYTLTVGPAEAQRYTGINDRGDIIGVGRQPGAQNGQAFVIKAGTSTPQFLSTPDDPGNTHQFTEPLAINDNGVTVGDVYLTPTSGPVLNVHRPTRWDGPGATGVDLGIDPNKSFYDVRATGINGSGLIVGKTLQADGHTSAWTVSGSTITRLPPLPGGTEGRANAVNDKGVIVGSAIAAGNATIPAVEWMDGRIRSLGILPGGTYAEARAVNSSGVAAGQSTVTTGKENGTSHAVVFRDGTVTDLNVPGTGRGDTVANAINDSGTIVGQAVATGFVYQNGVATDLSTLIPADSGYHILTAHGINDDGRIVATATKTANGSGTRYPVLLTPTG